MSEQTELKVRHIQTSVDGEVYEKIEKGVKETGAKSRAEYIRDILTLWHKYPNEGRQGLIQEIEVLKTQVEGCHVIISERNTSIEKIAETMGFSDWTSDTIGLMVHDFMKNKDEAFADVVRELVSVKKQRDEHLQACKSHIIEFRSIQELLGIDSGMACPERIVAKIQELSQQRVDASKQLLEQVERYDASGKIHEQVVKEATEQIDELSAHRKEETARADKCEKQRDTLQNEVDEIAKSLRCHDNSHVITDVVGEVKSHLKTLEEISKERLKWRRKAEDAEDAEDENNLLKNTISDLEADIKSRKSGMSQLDKEIGKLVKENDVFSSKMGEIAKSLNSYDNSHVKTVDVVSGVKSHLKTLSDLKTNLENSAVSAKKDEASIEHLEKIRQTFMKAFHIKDGDNIERAGETVEQDRFLLKEREHELDFFMNREPIYKIAWKRLVQFFTKKEK